MHRLVGLCIGAALLAGAAGCAAGAATPAGPATAGPPTSAGGVSGCPAQVVVTEKDSGTICVARGGTVFVLLHGSPGQVWRAVQATGEALSVVANPPAPSSPGLPSITADYTVGAFTAVQAGTAQVTSSRSACPPPSPGSVACQAMQAFEVAVTVG